MKKVTINEDDFKKLVLAAHIGKPLVKLPTGNLQVINLWRVIPKVVTKVLRQTGYEIVDNKGRLSVKETETN